MPVIKPIVKKVGIEPAGTKQITANGEYDVKEFANAKVNVPTPEGYITPEGTLEITENGTHDVTSYAEAEVNVPIPDGYLKPSGTKQITENGEYDVTENSSVDVNVPIPEHYIMPVGTKDIIANGEYDITKYAEVNVLVKAGYSGGEWTQIEEPNDTGIGVVFEYVDPSSINFIVVNRAGGSYGTFTASDSITWQEYINGDGSDTFIVIDGNVCMLENNFIIYENNEYKTIVKPTDTIIGGNTYATA